MRQDIVHCEVLAAKRARFARLDPPLPGLLQQALVSAGAKNLYLHQAEGVRLARQGRHVVTVTPTASGKTLVYTLPIIEQVLAEPDTRALLLFPLKALAQDQFKRLREMCDCLGLPQSTAAIYDGDTTPYFRAKIRQNPPNLLLTNPDMLHQGILPFHARWDTLFRSLRFVVIDELHTYKGVFGSHVLQILHRLRRVALFYQAYPQFLATSATIANPRELAEQLTGLPFDLVEENGAPSAALRIFLVNPSASSLYTVATRLFTEAIKAGQKTILFTKARKITELIHRWTLSSNPGLSGRISAYRSGYLPSERREIEQKLRCGVLDGVICTSALEMGIDIGGLDICILVGYPGTITATWQRAGRVGRMARESAIFLIAQPDALDQYFMRHPKDFFQRGVEAGVVDAANPYLLKSHLVCAAQEVPLRPDDQVYPINQVYPMGAEPDELHTYAEPMEADAPSGAIPLELEQAEPMEADAPSGAIPLELEQAEPMEADACSGAMPCGNAAPCDDAPCDDAMPLEEEMDAQSWAIPLKEDTRNNAIPCNGSIPRNGSIPCNDSIPRNGSIPHDVNGSIPRNGSIPHNGNDSIPRNDSILHDGNDSIPHDDSIPCNDSIPRNGSIPHNGNDSIPRNDSIPCPRSIPETIRAVIRELTESGDLIEAADGAVWFSNRKRPHREVDIRGAGSAYAIVEEESRRLIGQVNGLQAFTEAHPGAVYLHAGQTYLVKHFDLGSQDIWVSGHGEVSYYTVARTRKETEILEILDSRENKRFAVNLGRLKVTEWVVGYEKRRVSNREKISVEPLDLPPVVFETVGLWLQPSASAVAGLINEKYHLMGSLHAIEHASLALLPLFALCDRNDVGGISFTSHPQVNGAVVFLYDGHPGGVGLSARAYQVLDELSGKVLALVEGCACQEGCPSCIHSPKCGNGNTPLDKEGCIRLLQHLTGKKELSGTSGASGKSGASASSGAPGMLDTSGMSASSGASDTSDTSEISGGLAETSDGLKGSELPRPYMSRLPLADGHDIVVFDLETQLSAQEVGGWHNAHLMRLSLGVIYERSTGQYRTYREHTVKDLLKRLAEAELVVGFNQKRFDYSVLRAYTSQDLSRVPSLDLLDEIYSRHGFRLSLQAIVSATFGTSKCGDGLDALRWWKEGKIEEIERYCRMDVELTARLFDHILEHGYLLYENKNHGRVRLPLELPLDKVFG